LGFLSVSRAVETYAMLGLPVTRASCQIGEDFLRSIFRYDPTPDMPFGNLLTRVVGELIEERRPDRVLIPLSAGNDSRGLLGAALRVLPKERLVCVTVGEARSDDMVGAKAICRRLGIQHHRIDPIRFEWSVDQAVAAADAAFERQRVFRLVDLLLFDEIARFATPGTILLSGFFGDVAGGVKLDRTPARRDGNDPQDVIDMFVAKNRTWGGPAPDEEAIETLQAFGDRSLTWLRDAGFRAMTRYETMDFGLRMALRIGANTGIGDSEVHSPYTDPRILTYMFNRSYEERVFQRLYKQSLRAAFPDVFCLAKDAGVPGSAGTSRLESAARRRLDSLLDRVQGTSERGDVPYGHRRRQFLLELLDRLENRDCLPDWNIGEIRRSYLEGRQKKALAGAKVFASLETHIAAGTLSRVDDAASDVAADLRLRPSA
jgi:hypothetical protein